MIIYHNPRCSKSRQSLALLRENGEEPEVIEYLKTSLDEVALRDLFAKLGLEAHEVVRTKEEPYEPRSLTRLIRGGSDRGNSEIPDIDGAADCGEG